MLLKHSKKPLPLSWQRLKGVNKALLEGYVMVRGVRGLRAKVLVFKNNKDLCDFWKGINKNEYLGKNCLGVVNALGYELTHFPKKGQKQKPAHLVVDKNFFCVIGLIVTSLGMEIITHECVHAAYAYAKRVKRNLWLGSHDLDEENICYPAGIIASGVNKLLRENGMYDIYEKHRLKQEKKASKNTSRKKTSSHAA
jgi:hypothetical protein